MVGLGSFGTALGAVSTVTSLIEAVTANAEKPAGANAPVAFWPAATRSEHVTIEPASRSSGPAQSARRDSGAVVPNFDEHTMVALVALQE